MQEIVQKYYGETLTDSSDLQTNACCTDTNLPEYAKPLLAKVHDEVLRRYYGCGLVLPQLLGGLTVLDLGCEMKVKAWMFGQPIFDVWMLMGGVVVDNQMYI